MKWTRSGGAGRSAVRVSPKRPRAIAAVAGLLTAALAGCALFGPSDGRITVKVVNAEAANGETMYSCVAGDWDATDPVCEGTTVITDGTASTQFSTVFDGGELWYAYARVGYDESGIVQVEIDGDTTVRLDYALFREVYPGPSGPGLGPKVICAELHRQGLMEERIFQADEAFGARVRDNDGAALLGYQLWAVPLVRQMRRSTTVTRMVNAIARPWSYEMAYIMGARDEGDPVGRMLMLAGLPVCRTFGRIARLAGRTGPSAPSSPAAALLTLPQGSPGR